jgi:NAD(P)H-flavin reductase
VQSTEALIVERRRLAPGLVLLWFSAPSISRAARPGQFVMALTTPGLDPFLPRAFWIHRMRDGDSGEEMALLIREAGWGTRLLAGAVPGQRFQLTGPLGRSLRLAPGVRHLLLIAEGIAVAPLIWLADEESARGRSVTLLLVAPSGALPYPLDLLRPELEVVTAGGENPGEAVRRLLPELAAWADQLVVSAPSPVSARVREVLYPLPFRRPCIVLLAPQMPCGTGICGVCAVATRRRGTRLACVDGPAFDLRELV